MDPSRHVKRAPVRKNKYDFIAPQFNDGGCIKLT